MTIADVLRHEGGMLRCDHPIPLENFTTENLKKNLVGKFIEIQQPSWTPGVHREYHGVTKDSIMNEVFRRVEPSGRTMGEYMEQEISGPLDINAHIMLNDEQLKNDVNGHYNSMWK